MCFMLKEFFIFIYIDDRNDVKKYYFMNIYYRGEVILKKG